MAAFEAPNSGEPTRMVARKYRVPHKPLMRFIEGDGTGPESCRAVRGVVDAAVERACRGAKGIAMHERYAGDIPERPRMASDFAHPMQGAQEMSCSKLGQGDRLPHGLSRAGS